MNELINTECELRKSQSTLGSTLITATGVGVILIGAIPLLSTMLDENVKWANIVMSESYIRLIVILSIPLLIGLTAGIILIKSSVKKIAESYRLYKTDLENLIDEMEDEKNEKVK